MLRLLKQLPIDLSEPRTKDQLRDSGIGKNVFFLYKLSEETTANRQLAKARRKSKKSKKKNMNANVHACLPMQCQAVQQNAFLTAPVDVCSMHMCFCAFRVLGSISLRSLTM